MTTKSLETEHTRQKERGLQRDCKCVRAECDKLSNALLQLKQQLGKENSQRRDKDVQSLALESKIPQLSQTEQILKKDLLAVTQARLTSKERLLK